MSEQESRVRSRSPNPTLDDSTPSERAHLAEPPIEQHDRLYFDDGNIVLIGAPDELPLRMQPDSDAADPSVRGAGKARLAFRVYRGVLAKYSTVFADMLSLPLTGNYEQYDGVVCVHLPDPSVQLESLLLAMFYGTNLMKGIQNTNDYTDQLEGAVVLSKKYMMNDLLDCIATAFEDYWPRTLNDWDRINVSHAVLRERVFHEVDKFGKRASYGDSMSDVLPDPASAVRVGRLGDIPHILPAALYELYRIEAIEDPQVVHSDDCLEYLESLELARTARWDLVSRQDFLLLKLAKGRMNDFLRRTIWGDMIMDFSHRCAAHKDESDEPNAEWSKCNERMADFWSDLVDRSADSNDPLTELGRFHAKDNDICATCRTFVQFRTKRLREAFWKELPRILSVNIRDGWNKSSSVDLQSRLIPHKA